ncbi:MAG: hypothetical protein K6E85_14180 [Lachnospiraceae bacterium]|nr:hypothetical protein [Lachnospiraceae bacterium]
MSAILSTIKNKIKELLNKTGLSFKELSISIGGIKVTFEKKNDTEKIPAFLRLQEAVAPYINMIESDDGIMVEEDNEILKDRIEELMDKDPNRYINEILDCCDKSIDDTITLMKTDKEVSSLFTKNTDNIMQILDELQKYRQEVISSSHDHTMTRLDYIDYFESSYILEKAILYLTSVK